MHVITDDAVEAEAAAHVDDGHVPRGQYRSYRCAFLTAAPASCVFIDQSIHPACCRVPRAAGLHALTHVQEAGERLRRRIDFGVS